VQDLRPAFGARVKALRTALELTQEQLAERADMHWTFISGIERGVRNPGLNSIGRIAAALGVPPATLFSENASFAKGTGKKRRKSH
jgi:transcriptional regulator with XRE-family HTH domain